MNRQKQTLTKTRRWEYEKVKQEGFNALPSCGPWIEDCQWTTEVLGCARSYLMGKLTAEFEGGGQTHSALPIYYEKIVFLPQNIYLKIVLGCYSK